MALQTSGFAGPKVLADGAETPQRMDRQGAGVVTDAHGRYHEAAVRGKLFSAFLAQGTSTVAAGNINGAAAAASTQFAVWNPLTSGVNLVLLKLFVPVYSGTPTAGGLFHSTFNAASVSLTTTAGAVRNNYSGGALGGALCLASAAGAALTGGLALSTLRPSFLSGSGTAVASASGMVGMLEEMAGDIVIPPGQGYVPTWAGAGTTFLVGYGLTWEEVPV